MDIVNTTNQNSEVKMNLYEKHLSLRDEKKKIEAQLLETEVAIYEENMALLSEKDEGVINIPVDGFKVKVTKKMTVSVDQKLADIIKIGFRAKYDLDKKEYAKLNDDQKKSVDECLTTKPAKPSFSIERE